MLLGLLERLGILVILKEERVPDGNINVQVVAPARSGENHCQPVDLEVRGLGTVIDARGQHLNSVGAKEREIQNFLLHLPDSKVIVRVGLGTETDLMHSHLVVGGRANIKLRERAADLLKWRSVSLMHVHADLAEEPSDGEENTPVAHSTAMSEANREKGWDYGRD